MQSTREMRPWLNNGRGIKRQLNNIGCVGIEPVLFNEAKQSATTYPENRRGYKCNPQYLRISFVSSFTFDLPLHYLSQHFL